MLRTSTTIRHVLVNALGTLWLPLCLFGCSESEDQGNGDDLDPDESRYEGACLESLVSPIRCTELDSTDLEFAVDFKLSCEAQDDSYHTYEWIHECPAGITAGCRFDRGSANTITEWVYGSLCLHSGEDVDAPPGKEWHAPAVLDSGVASVETNEEVPTASSRDAGFEKPSGDQLTDAGVLVPSSESSVLERTDGGVDASARPGTEPDADIAIGRTETGNTREPLQDGGGAQPDAEVDAASQLADIERLLNECDGAPKACFETGDLAGLWECSSDVMSSAIVVDSTGRMHSSSSNDQSSEGCIQCDGSFESLSTPDSGGTPPVFADVNGRIIPIGPMPRTGLIVWDFCGESTDLDGCREAPADHDKLVCGTPALGGPSPGECGDTSLSCLADLTGDWICSNEQDSPGYSFTYTVSADGTFSSSDSVGQASLGCIDCQGRHGGVSEGSSYSAFGILDAPTGILLSNYCPGSQDVDSCREEKQNATPDSWQCTH